MTDSPAQHEAAFRHMRKRREEIKRLANELRAAETRVTVLRSQLDSRLHDYHAEGMEITELARLAGTTRQTVYRSLERGAVSSH